MAGLSIGELEKRDNYEVFAEKVKSGDNFITTSGTLVVLKKQKKLFLDIKNAKEDFHKYITVGNRRSIEVPLSNGSLIKLSDLAKTSEFGGGGGAKVSNKGDVAEGILSIGIFLRFMSKMSDVKNSDIMDYMSKMSIIKKGKIAIWEETKTSKNLNDVLHDSVSIKIGLAESHMKSMLNSSFWKNELKDIINAATKYANSKDIKEIAELLYNNNKKDEIQISSVGTENQKGTKADLRIIINGKEYSSISLKYGNVKQFGQLGGTDFDKLSTFFGELGVSYTNKDKEKYYQLLQNDVREAFVMLYKTVSDKKLIDSSLVSKFIKYHATLNENNVKLVQLDKEVKTYDFDKLIEKLKGKIAIQMVSSKKWPELIFSYNKESILTIRMKVEYNKTKTKSNPLGIYVRTYVEKADGLSKLIAYSA